MVERSGSAAVVVVALRGRWRGGGDCISEYKRKMTDDNAARIHKESYRGASHLVYQKALEEGNISLLQNIK